MAKIFNPISDNTITEMIEYDVNNITSEKSIAVTDQLTNNFKTSPRLTSQILNTDDWSKNVIVEFINDDNDSTNNTYKKLLVSNIPQNENNNDRTLNILISYEQGSKSNTLNYKIIQKKMLVPIVIQLCKYEAILFQSKCFIKLYLNVDEQGSNFLIGFNKDNLAITYDLESDVQTTLLAYRGTVPFMFNNKIDIPVSQENYTEVNASANTFYDDNERINKNKSIQTSEPITFNNLKYKFYFLFNSPENNNRYLANLKYIFNKTNFYDTNGNNINYLANSGLLFNDNNVYLNKDSFVFGTGNNKIIRLYIQFDDIKKQLRLSDKALFDSSSDNDKIKITLSSVMQFIPTPGNTLNNNNPTGVLTEPVKIHFIFNLKETYDGPNLFPTPESFNGFNGFKINFSDSTKNLYNFINLNYQKIGIINLFKYKLVTSRNTNGTIVYGNENMYPLTIDYDEQEAARNIIALIEKT